MEKSYLFVPFEEREDVKRLGARWDADAKCWYLAAGQDPAPFSRWLGIERATDSDYSIVSECAAVVTARVRCWKCRAGIEVVCLYCLSGTIDGEPYEEFTISNITAIDDALRRQLAPWPDFRFAHSSVAGGRYLVNHCPRCRVQQADYYLHCEPSGAFFSLRDIPAGAVRVAPLVGRVRLTGDEGFEP